MPGSFRICLVEQFTNRLTSDQKDDLERNVTLNEIKSAVWDCGTNKSPGSDGVFPSGCNYSFIALIPKNQDAKVVNDFRPISLIGSLYKIITKILSNRSSLVISDLISDVQSAFVTNRQILDGPFILNELLSWCKHKKMKSMFFKRGWISGCLKSAMGSVLVNGNPTIKFQFHKGLKQGDPLSLFLFILVMESLYLSFRRVIDAGLFSGISINNSLIISNLFYADDAVFVGKRDMSNINTIVDLAAREVGCSTFSHPFTHLGVKVGGGMSRIKSWDEVLCKVSSRLSKWKLKTLSIGGRLTLIKSVLSSIPLYHMSIFKVPMEVLHSMESIRRNFINGIDGSERKLVLISWKKVLASKKYGGLGVSNDMALKHRYPRLYALELSKYISVSEKLSSDSLVFSFRRIPKGGIEEEQQRSLQARIEGIILAPMLDRWIWSYESSGEFSVKSARSFIDDSLLPKEDVPTRWVNVIPI
ncbi:RNA-directed DNA polymerase, eukaryota [Tanacetum coccineum]|uniref:RNA-directed DNA polymerase, eukaryota n=1 Tax=Tanacetum coccineum TaxID=301880 RepID=A0ABQ5CXW9_9ASTR